MLAILSAMRINSEIPSYHHGDLRQSLLEVATHMIGESGIEGLSLRKLASSAGVSRTAPYHHFKDKNALLCAIAEQGFRQYHTNISKDFNNQSLSMAERFKLFIHSYVAFASNNPELYELMFGRTIWKYEKSTQALRDIAYPCFQYQLEMTKTWQELGLLNSQENPLRLSQVIWGTLHGITKLMIDGIYSDSSHVAEICECAVNVFMKKTT